MISLQLNSTFELLYYGFLAQLNSRNSFLAHGLLTNLPSQALTFSYNLPKYFFILCLYIHEHLILSKGKREVFTRKVHLCPQKPLDLRSCSVSFLLGHLYSHSFPFSLRPVPTLTPLWFPSCHCSQGTHSIFPYMQTPTVSFCIL